MRANEEIIQSQKEKIKQQDKEFANNSDRIFKQGDLIEEQKQELQQLTVRIEDVETLLDEVSSEAYDKAVEKVAKEAMLATRRDDIRLVEDSKKWIQDPKHKASRREKEYAIKRLDGLIQKIETAMEKIVIRITSQLKQKSGCGGNQKRSEAIYQRKTCTECSKDSKRRGGEKTTEKRKITFQ